VDCKSGIAWALSPALANTPAIYVFTQEGMEPVSLAAGVIFRAEKGEHPATCRLLNDGRREKQVKTATLLLH
jgi:hypothetical protein